MCCSPPCSRGHTLKADTWKSCISLQGCQNRTFGQTLGKRKHTPPCSNAELFFAEKKWGPQRKDFGGRYGFPGFYRVFVSTTGLESFSFRPEKFPKRFSFGGGRVRFFLLWNMPLLEWILPFSSFSGIWGGRSLAFVARLEIVIMPVFVEAPCFFQQFPRVTSIGSQLPKTSENPADPRRTPQRPRRTLGETLRSPLRDPRRALWEANFLCPSDGDPLELLNFWQGTKQNTQFAKNIALATLIAVDFHVKRPIFCALCKSASCKGPNRATPKFWSSLFGT